MRRHGFLKPAAVLLATVFFVAQAFACCQANARIGHSLASLFSRAAHPEHACCAKTNPVAPPARPDCARQCCLQEAAQHAPQLASEPSDIPQFSAPLLTLAPVIAPSLARGEWPPIVFDSGPPLYLRTLRLLV